MKKCNYITYLYNLLQIFYHINTRRNYRNPLALTISLETHLSLYIPSFVFNTVTTHIQNKLSFFASKYLLMCTLHKIFNSHSLATHTWYHHNTTETCLPNSERAGLTGSEATATRERCFFRRTQK